MWVRHNRAIDGLEHVYEALDDFWVACFDDDEREDLLEKFEAFRRNKLYERGTVGAERAHRPLDDVVANKLSGGTDGGALGEMENVDADARDQSRGFVVNLLDGLGFAEKLGDNVAGVKVCLIWITMRELFHHGDDDGFEPDALEVRTTVGNVEFLEVTCNRLGIVFGKVSVGFRGFLAEIDHLRCVGFLWIACFPDDSVAGTNHKLPDFVGGAGSV